MKKFLFIFVTIFIFMISLASCDSKKENTVVDDYKITVTAPSGAPAVALATLAINNKDNYNFIAAKTIGTAFSSDGSDVVIAPINAGAKLFKAGKSSYRLAAVITWGNLYFASQIEDFDLSKINGKEVILFGENTINAAVAKYVLEKNNIDCTFSYLAEAADTQQKVISDANAIVLTAEPALTAAKTKKNLTGISVQTLYKNASGNSEFTQAGIFVKADTIKNHEKALSDYLLEVKEATDKISSNLDNVAEACVSLELMPALPVAKAAIPNCNIKYKDAVDVKGQIEATAKLSLTDFGGDLPSEEFYYSPF